MTTIENPTGVAASPYPALRILGWSSLACTVAVVGFVLLRVPDSAASLLLALLLLVVALLLLVVVSFATFMVVLWVAAVGDTASFSPEAWRRSGHVRWVWTGVTLFLCPIGSLVWYAAIRPQLARAEQAR